jgi:hypothetical protein
METKLQKPPLSIKVWWVLKSESNCKQLQAAFKTH